jgi:uncharacterized metal-binding protein YceD (DUF177 family)
MDRLWTAITVHRIPGTEICGVVVLKQQADGSWPGSCSRCAKSFHRDKDTAFERQVLALRN